MLRKTIFTCVAAMALGFAASAASTDASAAPAKGGFRTATVQGKTVGRGNVHIAKVSLVRPGGGRTRCLEAECGGGPVPIDATYVVRGCQMTPAGSPLPPWCEGATGVPRRAPLGFRR